MQPLRLELRAAPVIGRTSFGQEILLGGFSGLRFLGRSPSGLYRFLTHTDRGPNTDEKVTSRGQERPFGLPSFQPQIVFLEADLKLGKLFVSGLLPLFQNPFRGVRLPKTLKLPSTFRDEGSVPMSMDSISKASPWELTAPSGWLRSTGLRSCSSALMECCLIVSCRAVGFRKPCGTAV